MNPQRTYYLNAVLAGLELCSEKPTEPCDGSLISFPLVGTYKENSLNSKVNIKGLDGFEPTIHVSKSCALPLGYSPNSMVCIMGFLFLGIFGGLSSACRMFQDNPHPIVLYCVRCAKQFNNYFQLFAKENISE